MRCWRARQATIPAFIVALGVGVVVAIVVSVATQRALNAVRPWRWATGVLVRCPALPRGWTVLVAIAAVAITTLVTLAIGVATNSHREGGGNSGGARRNQADSRWAGAIATWSSKLRALCSG